MKLIRKCKSSVLLAFLVVIALVLFAVTGCAAESPSGATQQQAPAESQTQAGETVIDVRTADEYAAGHLDGAINIDYYGADFSDKVSELDKDDSYVLYCRTGVRAGKALEIMSGLGFTDVTNGMGMEAAANSTGLDVVK